jgi:hypothetical protein
MDIVVNFITFVFSRFRDSFFAENHLLICQRNLFDNMQRSFKLLTEIITLVSTANIIGTDEVFNVGRGLC